MNSPGWCTIESDPYTFAILIKKIGAKGIQIEEAYDLDDLNVTPYDDVLGFIFLYKWGDDPNGEIKSNSPNEAKSNIYFAKQLVKDACATHAILSILLNADCDVGDKLEEFKKHTNGLNPTAKGLAVGSTEFLRIAHNSFAPMINLEEETDTGDKAAYHFVSFIQSADETYELDGLKESPICHGKIKNTFSDHVIEIIKEKIDRAHKLNPEEVCFNLLLVLKDRIPRIVGALEGEEDQNKVLQLQELLEEERSKKIQLEEAASSAKYDSSKRQHPLLPLTIAVLEKIKRFRR